MNYLMNQATTTKMLTKYGQPVVITSEVAGNYNLETSTIVTTKTTQTSVGAVFDWGGGNAPRYGQQWIDAGLIQVQDKMLILSVGCITPPNLGDTVTLQGKPYSIVPPLKIEAPAGIPLFIVCNIRGI